MLKGYTVSLTFFTYYLSQKFHLFLCTSYSLNLCSKDINVSYVPSTLSFLWFTNNDDCDDDVDGVDKTGW